MASRARVARFYTGVNPFVLSDADVLGLEANIERLKAQDTLDEARLGRVRLTAEGWFDLTLLATGDHEAAEAAHNASVRADLKAGRTPQ